MEIIKEAAICTINFPVIHETSDARIMSPTQLLLLRFCCVALFNDNNSLEQRIKCTRVRHNEDIMNTKADVIKK